MLTVEQLMARTREVLDTARLVKGYDFAAFVEVGVLLSNAQLLFLNATQGDDIEGILARKTMLEIVTAIHVRLAIAYRVSGSDLTEALLLTRQIASAVQ